MYVYSVENFQLIDSPEYQLLTHIIGPTTKSILPSLSHCNLQLSLPIMVIHPLSLLSPFPAAADIRVAYTDLYQRPHD